MHRWHLARRPGALRALGICLLALGGCRTPSPPPRPLQEGALLAEVRAARKAPTPAEGLTLADAVERMRRHNPAIRRARAAWRTAAAVAAVPSPLPNPRLEAGPLLVGGGDILSSVSVGAVAALGWAVPLTARRSLRDAWTRVVATAALTEAVAVERAEYLELRRVFLDALVEEALLDARRDLANTAHETEAAMRRSVDAGEATLLDQRLVELEGATFAAELVTAEESLAAARNRLGSRLGARGENLRPAPHEAPQLPPDVPPLDRLEDLAAQGHPDLAVLRAEYVVAEKRLRLEASAAIPDLDLGAEFEDEVTDQRLGIPLGIELPLFDRNQPGIAEACATRDEVRERYAARLAEVLASIESARARVLTRVRVVDLLADQVVQADVMQDTAEQVLAQSGTLDLIRYLEVLRTIRRVRIGALEARSALYQAWGDLEAACGVPLLRFAHEPATAQQGS